MNDKDDITLIRQINQGDVTAFSQIIDRHQNMAFTLANSIVKNRQEAEEVTQDAFVKAYKSLAGFKGDSAFTSWLYRIVYNTAISKLRSRKPQTEDLESRAARRHEMMMANDNKHRLENQERKILLKKALQQLKEEDAFILILFYYKELSVDEISETTGLSASNVKVKLHRGRQQMHKALNNLLKGEINSIL